MGITSTLDVDLLFSHQYLHDNFNPFDMTNYLSLQLSQYYLNPPFKKKYQNILFFVCYSPCDLLISAIGVYILIPFMSLKSGIIIAVTGKGDDTRMITKRMPAKVIPFLRLFENVGEAVPHAIMCLLFIINNFDFVNQGDTLMPLPISIISLIFSVGSIAMGIYTGMKSCKNILYDDVN